MNQPRYCPNCGAELTDNGRAAVPIIDPETQDGGYDCYCKPCGWSGDIYPDDEQGIYGQTSSPARRSWPPPRPH